MSTNVYKSTQYLSVKSNQMAFVGNVKQSIAFWQERES